MADKPKLSPLMILPPLIFLALGLMFYMGLGRPGARDLPSTFVGKPAPAITEVALTGYAPVTPEVLAAGEVTIVNFWASWCPPCRAEHPRLMQMKAEGLNIVGVNMKDQESQARQVLEQDGNPFAAIAFDPSGRTSIEWGVTGPPETFILDGDGVVLFKFIGPLVGSDYEQRFLPALNAALGR